MQKNVPLNPPATSLNPLKDAVGVTQSTLEHNLMD